MPDRRTSAIYATLGLLTAAIVLVALVLDPWRHDHLAWRSLVPVTLGSGVVAGLLSALGSRWVHRRRRAVLPAAGVAVGLVVGLAGYLWARYGPVDTEVVYHGRYVPLAGITVSRAYSSTLDITYDGPVSWWSLLLTGAVGGLVAGLVADLVTRRFRGLSSPSE